MKKILIVEDELINSKILFQIIKNFFETQCDIDFVLDVATNGYEALGMHSAYEYDLILLDVKMPKCDGLEFLSLLRNNKTKYKQASVSIFTAIDQMSYINLFRNKGANSFLIKPYEAKKVFQILEHSLGQNLEEKIEVLHIQKEQKPEYFEKKDDIFDEFEDIENKESQVNEFEDIDEFEDFDEFEEFEDFDDLNSTTDETTQNAINEMNKTHIRVSAKEFLEDYENIDYILEDIEDIDYTLENIIESMSDTNIDDYLDPLEDCLRKYVTFLNSMASFGELSTTISLLNNKLQNSDFNNYEGKTKFFIIETIRSILTDLQNWKDFVFIKQTANDVYYINASILSNFIQLEDMMKTR